MGYQNFFATRLATEIGASDTVITLENVPAETSGKLVLEARNPTQREIITYTNISGNQITGVTRGYGGTTAKPHLKNSLVEMNLTAEDLQEIYDLFDTGSVLINTAKLARFVAGAGVPDSVGVLGNEVYFTTVGSNTYTKPEGLRFVIVEVQAGGGGGGYSGINNDQVGAGGGGGGYVKKKILASDLAATETVTVGKGGTGSSSGNSQAGGNSSFGTHVTAGGGGGGGHGSNVGTDAGGALGGTATGGDFNIPGSNGAAGGTVGTVQASILRNGFGGSSFLGSATTRDAYGGTNQAGDDGRLYGSGGSGGYKNTTNNAPGGNGAQGIVIVKEFF